MFAVRNVQLQNFCWIVSTEMIKAESEIHRRILSSSYVFNNFFVCILSSFSLSDTWISLGTYLRHIKFDQNYSIKFKEYHNRILSVTPIFNKYIIVKEERNKELFPINGMILFFIAIVSENNFIFHRTGLFLSSIELDCFTASYS